MKREDTTEAVGTGEAATDTVGKPAGIVTRATGGEEVGAGGGKAIVLDNNTKAGPCRNR